MHPVGWVEKTTVKQYFAAKNVIGQPTHSAEEPKVHEEETPHVRRTKPKLVMSQSLLYHAFGVKGVTYRSTHMLGNAFIFWFLLDTHQELGVNGS
ncbi:MAG: hypothetical protein PHI97_26770 [Desulfobulbus sp.]|nr:hypothetical protein [Desulfobulbus sp.]